MSRRLLIPAFAVTPFLLAATVQAPPTSDQVFKNIQVFKGVPSTDLIPAMQFMCASLKYECSDCHNPKDFSEETRAKETARKMILMQREINAKNFNGRVEVTCMSCHGGKEHPAGTPIPEGISLRHQRVDGGPKPEDLFAKHIAAAGTSPAMVVLTGTLTAPNDETHKVETKPLEFIQGDGGRFRMISGDRKCGSDGTIVWYGPYPLADEAAAIFNRLGRTWRGPQAFAGLEKPAIAGKDTIGKQPVFAVRGTRASTMSTEELDFDASSGLLARLVNIRRSTIGTVITALDYQNYKAVSGAKIPMKVTATYPDGSKWIMEFKSVRTERAIDEARFKMGG